MTKKFFSFIAGISFFLGCADIPEELRDQAEGKCGGQKYSDYQFCANGKVYDLCNGVQYNPSVVGCCNSRQQYTLATEFCYSGLYVYPKCGGNTYNLETQFCSGSKVYSKCGGSSYDPDSYFCYGNSSYSLCGGKEYNPNTQTCRSGIVEGKCGSSSYNVSTEFCLDSKVYSLCGGKTYNPSNQKCESSVVKTKCDTGSNYYNPSTEFCSSGSVYSRCGGNTYDPSSQRCQNNVVETKCGTGSNYYNYSTQFCYDNKVYDLCNGEDYRPSSQICENGVINSKCGTESYDPSIQFCSSNKVYDRCNGKTYDPSNQICEDDVVILTKCDTGSNYYNPSTQFCSGSSVYDLCNGQSYTPASQRCENNIVETKCGSDWYNPSTYTQYCKDGTTLVQYGSITYSGQTYRTVEIGTKTWMAENLNYNASGSKCYSNNEANCDKYGRLYNWTTAMANSASSSTNPSGVKGICPTGWHLPSDAEWTELTTAVGGSFTGGTKLKSTSGWNNNGNGTDIYGFSALPGGYGDSSGDFYYAGYVGIWWSASEPSSNNAYYRRMDYDYADVGRYSSDKTYLLSVRCVQD